MKVLLILFAGLLLIIPAHNTNAQGPMNDSRSDPSLLNRRVMAGTSFMRQTHLNTGLMKTDTQVYLPDSLTLFSMSDTIRMSASYDARGWNTQILVQVLYGGHWVNYSRSTWTYLDPNASNLTLEQSWSNGQWINVKLDSSTYDARGNMLVHLFKYWSLGAWRDSILSSRTYDTHGGMLTNAGWFMINTQWTNHDRTTCTNDTSGNALSSVLQWWFGGAWVNQDMFTYTYDGNGRMLTRTMLVWNGQWQNATLSTYTYDANGNLQSYLIQNSASGQWTNSTIDTYTYDANGHMLTDWYKGWTNGSWMNGTLTTNTYDLNGNMVTALLQEWLNGLWTNYRQSTFTYDAHGNELSGNNTLWSGSSWVPTDYNFSLAVAGSTYDFTGYRISVSYILVNTAGVSKDQPNIAEGYSLSQNYPNPFNPSTTISFQLPTQSRVTLRVFDVLGREVAVLLDGIEQPGRKTVTFNANALASGVYYYRLQAGDFASCKKLLLLK